MHKAQKILLAGGGKMGAALLAGWIRQGISAGDITVIEPDPALASALSEKHGVRVLPELSSGEQAAALVILAVKPQVMAEVLPAYRGLANKGACFISIAAGKTLAFFDRHLGEQAAVVRTMPNLPSTVGKGITVLTANPRASGEQRKEAERLFQGVGEVIWTEDESLMDAVTALSGSGPAYLFLLAEVMIKAGVALGMPEEMAHKLTIHTLYGSGELLYRSGEAPALLRKQVTSPKGTTEAALSVLMRPGAMHELVAEAVKNAEQRAKELAE